MALVIKLQIASGAKQQSRAQEPEELEQQLIQESTGIMENGRNWEKCAVIHNGAVFSYVGVIKPKQLLWLTTTDADNPMN